MAKIKAIVKRTDEPFGHMTHIENTIQNLQKIVGGYIEVQGRPLFLSGAAIICNEEGKIRQMPINIVIGSNGVVWDAICGDLIVVGIDGEEFTDVPISFAEWKTLLKEWGNT